MRFQKKILLNYVTVLSISVLVICVLYYRLSWKRYVSEEYAYLQTLNGQMTQQLELEYNSMQEAAESLLSDSRLLNDLNILATAPQGNTYRIEAEKEIAIKLNTYHIVKNYYRVLIYNRFGDSFASYDFDDRKINDSIPEKQLAWMKEATGIRGRTILIPPHKDPWSKKDPCRVYGVLREILGYQAYLEVQQTEESLNRIFHIYDDNIRVTAIYGDGRILYGTADGDTVSLYENLGPENRDGVTEVKNPATGKTEIVSRTYSELSGVRIYLTEDRNVILQKMMGFLWMAFWVLLLFAGIFAFYIYQASKHVARPINELREQMEHGSLENLEEELEIEDSIDEIKALANAYGHVIRRLKESLIQEKNLSYLQLQARYDLLQAQINPHFFHNVLNVISSRGLSMGDETICEICESLSGMLRYATGNKTRYAVIEEETGYLEQYLYLMKLRYQHKIEYEIDVDERIKGQTVPKIVFQQIVENSIKHGFCDNQEVMKVSVKGRLLEEKNLWEMCFWDNGPGIDEETVKRLELEMQKMKDNLLNHHKYLEMEIGGMGLLNTYARLVLFFNADVQFSITGSKKGTLVVITAPMAENGGIHVSGFGGR